jgi:hypothetical protein
MLILAKPPAASLWSLIASTSVLSSVSGSVTTPAINTSGADLLVALNSGGYAPNQGSISDSKANTWSSAIVKAISGSLYTAILYCHNPVVGTGHTFTFSCTDTQYGSLGVLAFSGSQTADPVTDQSNSNTSSGVTTATPGPITPSANHALIISGLTTSPSGNETGFTIDSSFIISVSNPFLSGSNYGGAIAYLAQANATAVNPTWGWVPATDTAQFTAVIASFKGR